MNERPSARNVEMGGWGEMNVEGETVNSVKRPSWRESGPNYKGTSLLLCVGTFDIFILIILFLSNSRHIL